MKKHDSLLSTRLALAGIAIAATISCGAAAEGQGQKPPAPQAAAPADATKAAAPAPAAPADNAPDLAFGACQRGYYTTALAEATKRIQANPDDGAAMTLIGELYAQGLGVPRDLTEADRWYKLAPIVATARRHSRWESQS